jgi:hypothetical protein
MFHAIPCYPYADILLYARDLRQASASAICEQSFVSW